jgi:hypothetical protein
MIKLSTLLPRSQRRAQVEEVQPRIDHGRVSSNTSVSLPVRVQGVEGPSGYLCLCGKPKDASTNHVFALSAEQLHPVDFSISL